jgi:hypothetical protein
MLDYCKKLQWVNQCRIKTVKISWPVANCITRLGMKRTSFTAVRRFMKSVAVNVMNGKSSKHQLSVNDAAHSTQPSLTSTTQIQAKMTPRFSSWWQQGNSNALMKKLQGATLYAPTATEWNIGKINRTLLTPSAKFDL